VTQGRRKATTVCVVVAPIDMCTATALAKKGMFLVPILLQDSVYYERSDGSSEYTTIFLDLFALH
jgi:hypothetical protein